MNATAEKTKKPGFVARVINKAKEFKKRDDEDNRTIFDLIADTVHMAMGNTAGKKVNSAVIAGGAAQATYGALTAKPTHMIMGGLTAALGATGRVIQHCRGTSKVLEPPVSKLDELALNNGLVSLGTAAQGKSVDEIAAQLADDAGVDLRTVLKMHVSGRSKQDKANLSMFRRQAEKYIQNSE